MSQPKGVFLVAAPDVSGIYHFTIASRTMDGFIRLAQLIGEGTKHSVRELEKLVEDSKSLLEEGAASANGQNFFVCHFRTKEPFPYELPADGFYDKCGLMNVVGFDDYKDYAREHIASYILSYFASAHRTN